MQLHGKNFVGSRMSADGVARFAAADPTTSAALPTQFALATDQEIDQAVRLAEAAFGDLRALSTEKRAVFLERIGAEMEALGDELLHLAHQETGLPLARLTGERQRTVGQLRLFAQTVREGSWAEARIDTAQPQRAPTPRPDLRRMLVPLGPVGVFGASNFPFAFSVAGGDTASALAAGCPVVVKAHPAHPGTSELTAQAILAAAEATGMPNGIFSLLHGREQVSLALVRHPLLQAVGFTGSRAAGLALSHAVTERPHPIPVYAEMSSVNPVFVLSHALQERGAQIAAGLAASVALGVGQFCTNPGLVFGVAGAGWEAFLGALTAQMAQSAPGVMLTERICHVYHEGIARLRETPGVSQAVITAANGQTQAGAALFVTGTETFARTPHLADEVFGPVTLAVAAETPDGLLEAARGLEGQLTATVHGTAEDLREHAALISILETKAGRLVFNGFPTGVEVSPAMQHGGPFPATTDSRTTSIGTAAISRFARPLCFQDAPPEILPPELRDDNPRGIWRLVDGEWNRGRL